MVTARETKKGYKQTEVGAIPEDWEVKELGTIAHFENGKAHEGYISDDGDYVVINSKFISSEGDVIKYSNKNFSPVNAGDIALVMSDIPNGKALAKCYLIKQNNKFALNQRICSLRANEVNNYFLFYSLNRNNYFLQFDNGVSQTNLRKGDILSCRLAVPFTKEEQTAIATALSNVGEIINKLEELITKKRNIKQGAMQELLTGKKRLPGFNGKWEEKTLLELINCLDNLRVPLNDSQRLNMKGDYPYCGANGILDFINQYMIDDDIILIAEDGGYFDEYAYRPIAYRMSGKCWVNNHAHILKAKESFSQDFIFYSLVHKNILSFLASTLLTYFLIVS